MLLTLKIKNFALIADQTIEFDKGFNVLVGETGSGKSLILDALAFVLGEKASKINLRSGETKMSVQAVFDNNSPEIIAWLDQNGIDSDDNLILFRTQNIDGKTECRVNGVIVTAGALKSLSVLLVDAYAQNENIELLKVKNHIQILDAYNQDLINPIKQQISNKLQELKSLQEQMSYIGGNAENRERELELLNYQINDIENANLVVGEDEELKIKLEKLLNFEKIFDNVKYANQFISNVLGDIASASSSLEFAGKYDEELKSLSERIESCKLELDDINYSLSDYISNIDFDQNELQEIDSRLETIKLLKKKYGATIPDILEYLKKIKSDYDNLLFGEEKLNKLQNQANVIRQTLYDLSKNLSDTRQKIALEIENKVMQELKFLGFKNAVFKIGFVSLPEIEHADFTKNGIDNKEFLLSANDGEELKSLSKTISGGEMSRFMLALKNVFSKCLNPATLVFDEVDTGISGEIGQCVAERLARLASDSQLVCITHLCQVSAMADKYIFVQKMVQDNKTFTTVKYLNDEEIIKYIAIASGAQPTEVAMQFAKELKQKANEYKSKI